MSGNTPVQDNWIAAPGIPVEAPASAQTTAALRVQLKDPAAKAPSRRSDGAAGYDLHAAAAATVNPWARSTITTGLVVEIPEGHYGRIAPRSGLAVEHGIGTLAGVIDSDYRGIVKILLVNHSDKAFEVMQGSRIAQLVLERIATPSVEIVEGDLSQTTRGQAGFGSTGVGEDA